MERQRLTEQRSSKQLKRRLDEDELGQMKKRQKTLQNDIAHLEERAFSLSEQACSNSSSTQLFKEAHALNIRVRSLKTDLENLKSEIAIKEKESLSH